MIRLHRPTAEPAQLPGLRDDGLTAARVEHAAGRSVKREHLPATYRQVAGELWTQQRYKCAYCEAKEQQKRNDVEHFRPAGAADRMDGTHDRGYWWLAFSWENLLFACRNCNQSPHKLDKFPLEPGSPRLAPEDAPPGSERPMLVDPYREDPLDHLAYAFAKFERIDRWHVRGLTPRGEATIAITGLNRPDLLTLYTDHVTEVEGEVQSLRAAFATAQATSGDVCRVWNAVANRLFFPRRAFVALSADALAVLLTAGEKATWGIDPRDALRKVLAANEPARAESRP